MLTIYVICIFDGSTLNALNIGKTAYPTLIIVIYPPVKYIMLPMYCQKQNYVKRAEKPQTETQYKIHLTPTEKLKTFTA